MTSETRNAMIIGARFDTERGLSFWLDLDYGGCCQGFGGYLLYAPEGWRANRHQGNVCGHFIWRVLEIAGVDDVSKLKGKVIRARCSPVEVEAIGHAIKDDWFCPREELAKINANE